MSESGNLQSESLGPRPPETITNAEFLRELAAGAEKGSSLWVTSFFGNPDGNTGWGGGPWEGADREHVIDSHSDRNTYFSTAALRFNAAAGDPGLKRRLSHFDRQLALVVDDADVAELNGVPSWVLETSPGKRQVGLLLDVADPDAGDVKKCTAVVTKLHSKGLIGGDKSGNNAVRYVRLPQGQNQKPRDSGDFQTRLTQWNPRARYSLEDAAGVLGIKLDELLAEAATSPAQGTGAFTGDQDEKLAAATADILDGENLHDAVNTVAASLVASGTTPGAVVNMVKALMHRSAAPRNERWQERYNDIWRSVETAYKKFHRPTVENGGIDGQAGEEQKEPLFVWARDLVKDLAPIDFVIDAHLESNSISMAYGPSGCGKSFVALDMACAVSTGTPWCGHKTKKGTVFLIIGEGHNGFRRRIMGWAKKHGLEDQIRDAPLAVSKHSVNLSDHTAGALLAAEIDAMVAASGVEPVLIVVDTVARNIGTGDENSAKDIGVFIDNVDRYLRRRHGAHVMLIHHTGHNAERARGSSALRAALDQEFHLTGFGGRVNLECTKMKDAATPPEKRFKLVDVDLGQDSSGTPISGACAVLDGNPWDVAIGTPLVTEHDPQPKPVTAYAVIREWTQAPIENHAEFQLRFRFSKGTAGRAIEKLKEAGILVKLSNSAKAWYDLSEKTWAEARAMCWVADKAA